MKNRLYLNNIVSLIYQVTSVVVGLIIPRLLLNNYGSMINGYVSSITRMLGFISILDLGVGSVVQAALYKPLSMKAGDEISAIYSASKKYFRVIAKILCVYIIILCMYYSFNQSENYDCFFSTSLILSIAISSFAQYYFGICNTLLLNADQKTYIVTFINLITLLISTGITILLIYCGMSIQCVKFFSSFIYLGRPLFLWYYVNKNYNIIYNKSIGLNVLKNKWSGMAQHIATVLTGSIDYVVLTVFSTMKVISVYTVYVLPLNSIRDLISAICTGYKSYFGNLLAQNRIDDVNREFNHFEFLIHNIVVLIYGVTLRALVPFVILYTNGVNDAEYINYFFAYFITAAYALFALRIPYTTLIFAAGHFKETQKFCIFEIFLNIIISIFLVKKIGIVGVAVGTCVSVFYRLFASERYLVNHIINRKKQIFIKQIFVDALAVAIFLVITHFLKSGRLNLITWILDSLCYTLLMILVLLLLNFIFYRKEIIDVIYIIKNKMDSLKVHLSH